MKQDPASLLRDPILSKALDRAWEDSEPADSGGHEEGGFVVRDPRGRLSVVRWPRGWADTIEVPPHPDCKLDRGTIVASFHTHPNTGSEYLQEPSETDKRAVRDDPDLKRPEYQGEFVVSQEKIYLIKPDGTVAEMEDTDLILNTTRRLT